MAHEPQWVPLVLWLTVTVHWPNTAKWKVKALAEQDSKHMLFIKHCHSHGWVTLTASRQGRGGLGLQSQPSAFTFHLAVLGQWAVTVNQRTKGNHWGSWAMTWRKYTFFFFEQYIIISKCLFYHFMGFIIIITKNIYSIFYVYFTHSSWGIQHQNLIRIKLK